MAWRNLELTIANIPQSMVNDFSWCDTIDDGSAKVTFNGINPVNSGLADGYPIGDSSNGLKIASLDIWSWTGEIDYNNSNIYNQSQWTIPKTEEYSGTKISFIACINDENQKGIFLFINRWRDSGNWSASFSPYAINKGDAETYRFLSANEPMSSFTSNGGGATHIAKITGQLKDLSSNLSDILIVSGGGGGGMLVGETEYVGADAGGISGSGDNSADQSTGYAFGQGESGSDVSGGGGGLYGGYKGVIN